jgi:hypothetical protein
VQDAQDEGMNDETGFVEDGESNQADPDASGDEEEADPDAPF